MIGVSRGLHILLQDSCVSHIVLRAVIGVLVASPLVILIAFLMAVFDCAYWDIRSKHYRS